MTKYMQPFSILRRVNRSTSLSANSFENTIFLTVIRSTSDVSSEWNWSTLTIANAALLIWVSVWLMLRT